MLSREEYEKTYVRMMDSLRETHKGEKSCSTVDCSTCPINDLCKDNAYNSFFAPQFMDIVEQWGKEHPVTTNGDKFKEVFGTDFDDETCYATRDWKFNNCDNNKCETCPKGRNGEYHAPKGEEE